MNKYKIIIYNSTGMVIEVHKVLASDSKTAYAAGVSYLEHRFPPRINYMVHVERESVKTRKGVRYAKRT